ncbi:class I SAM-dependent methyltransferase [Patescibacteria group bacterium]|nr:class I SAM-dependent methyltransferase [Patescibacteria group bacterium]
MSNMEYVRCALCNSDDYVVISEKSRMKGGEYFDLRNVICKRCGLIYINPRMTKEGYELYYEAGFEEDVSGIHDRKTYFERISTRKCVVEEKCSKVCDFIEGFIKRGDGDFLDVGCSYGDLLKTVKKKFNISALGVEISPFACEIARESSGINIFQGSLDQFIEQVGIRKFGFISLRFVFEHFLDPVNKLRQLRKLLKEDGFLFIAIPDVTRVTKSIDVFFQIGHVFSYSPSTFFFMALRCGFKICKMEFDEKLLLQVILTPIENNINAVGDKLLGRRRHWIEISNFIKKRIVRERRIFKLKTRYEKSTPKFIRKIGAKLLTALGVKYK